MEILFVISVVLSLTSFAVTLPQGSRDITSGCPYGGYAPNPNNCSEFLQCDDNRWVVRPCTPGTVWNNDLQTCDWPWSNYTCSALAPNTTGETTTRPSRPATTANSTTPIIPTTRPVTNDSDLYCEHDDDLFSVPGDCTRFYKCADNTKVALDCQPELLWNDRLKVCDWPENVPECSDSNSTRTTTTRQPVTSNTTTTNSTHTTTTRQPVTNNTTTTDRPVTNDPALYCENDGYLFSVPGDCSRFYKCSDNTKVALDCQPGLLWNDRLKVCDWPENVPECSDSNSTRTTTTRQSVTSNTTTTDRPVTNDPALYCENDGDLFSVPGDCSRFYKCADNTKVALDCQPGLLWNDRLKVCDWPENVPECSDSNSTRTTTTRQPVTSNTTTTDRPVTDDPALYCEHDDELLPVPGDCTRFYKCADHTKVSLNCQPGLLWNDRQKVCDWPENVPECLVPN